MGELKQRGLFNQLNNLSIRMSFVLYALFSLLIGIIICTFLISMIDRYRINLNYKYENMTTRYDIPENGSFTATYSNDQTKYTIFDNRGNEICKFNVDYQKERPVHEYVYPNHVSYIEVSPNFTNHDRLVDNVLGTLNIAIIPIALSISMICCVTTFYKKKLSKPIKLLTNAYRKVETNDLDFALSYPSNDEMGKLCCAFEKMKDCLAKNNETMLRQFAEQRRLNAAFSHDLRTPLTLLKGHASMLLSFIPKGLVSQEEITEEISVMSKNILRLEKYVNAMTNLYRLEDIEMPRQYILFHSLISSLNETAELLCRDIHFSITSKGDDIALFINLDTVMQIYENLLSNSIRYAKKNITIGIAIQNKDLIISVSDDGCGFKTSDIEKATLPFYKSSKDISTEHLGLGLNICKILSERHGGNIQIANNKTGGACVTVKINCDKS
ncbi:MAG: HAMP domain-containing histidine kinase [Lachnospiraceae bacterium]|nr:HAMP domain-containing histidine kinase [Lachnospiraceae bacterium]